MKNMFLNVVGICLCCISAVSVSEGYALKTFVMEGQNAWKHRVGIEDSHVETMHEPVLKTLAEHRGTWTETELVSDSPGGYGQGKVDTVKGPDGRLWAVFFDDRNVPSGQGAYFMRVSTDGGATWTSPFSNNGFFFTSDVGDNPSLAVYEISPGTLRISVAVTGYYNGYQNTYCVYKAEGSGSWSQSVVQGGYYNFRLPRLCYAGDRLVAATVCLDDGNYYTDYSDDFGGTWTGYSSVSQASPGFSQVTQPDMAYDDQTGYFFCTMSASLSADPDKGYCLLALSTNRASSWKRSTASGTDVGPWSVGSTTVYAYDQGVVALTEGYPISDGHWLILVSQQAASSSDWDIGIVVGDYAQLVDHGSWWEPGTTFPYVLVDDTDGDEACVSLTAEPGSSGKFHASWVDANTGSDDEVWYSNCDFSDPSGWLLPPEEVSCEAGADPNVHFEIGQAASSSVVMGEDGSGNPRPVVSWADSRNSTVDIYSAYRADTQITPVPTPTSTCTPQPTGTPTPTVVPPALPATGAGGLLLLMCLISMIISTRRRFPH